ncbi:DUF2793 domain-containing protein [Oricola thermophila]|uniref:DUF2793 domain-containing protein n=1 Tax=Oricola thermophila TaxID=2742145 RepID=A0A6N1VDI3_9HYPH|nr:DUF2793 domain-containing protein [Oricola thermophila]QKV18778.1 DUF2793 domain-containing protein [Oricola thermophila]
MDTTPNLKMPYIMPSQAQKHVTHNEALRALDAIVQLGVVSVASAPPASPLDGERHIVGEGASGAWQGREGQVAAWQDGAWAFHAPRAGWLAWVAENGELLVFDGTGWRPAAASAPGAVAQLGINATPDETNRLALASPASLFSHEGSDHRMIVNKAAAGDTASILFQAGFEGRAEIGLAGSDDLAVKVADSAENWREAMRIDRETGAVRFPSGVANPQLHGVPDDPAGFDRIFLDAVNGDDANDGLTPATALKTAAGLAARFVVGRRLELRLLSDFVFDHLLVIGYVVPALSIFGRTADDSDWQSRKITVVDAANNANHPGGFMFQAFASVYTYRVNVELATGRPYALFDFYSSIGYLRTHTMTLTRTGTGACCLFANGASFVPSQHTNLVIGPSAAGHVANGVPAGANPNDDWRYPSNVTAF